MDEKEKLSQIIYEANKLKEVTRTSCVTLGNYCYYMDLKVNQQDTVLFGIGICSKPKAQVCKEFKRAFKSLNKLERAQFYLMTLKNVARVLKQHRSSNDTIQSLAIQQIIGNLESETKKMRICIKDGRIYKNWKMVDVEVFRKQKIIKIVNIKEEIDLHHFLIRHSKNKTRAGLVLEAINPNQIAQTIRISCSAIDLQDYFPYIITVWQEAQAQFIQKMYEDQSKFSKKKKKIISMKTQFQIYADDPMTCILSHHHQEDSYHQKLKSSVVKSPVLSLDGYKKIEKCLVSNALLQSLNSFLDFKQMSFGVYYDKNGVRVRKVFDLDHKFVTEKFISEIIDDISHIKRRKHTVQSLKILNQFPSQRTKIYRQFDHYGEEDVQYIYLRHNFYRNGITYFIQKSIDFQEYGRPKLETILRGNIQHCLWRIRRIGDKLQLFVEANITYNRKVKNSMELTSKYIGDFIDYVKNRVIEQENLFNQAQRGMSFESSDFEKQGVSEISQSFANSSQSHEQFYTISGDSFNDQIFLLPSLNDQSQTVCMKKVQSFQEQIPIQDQEILKQVNKVHSEALMPIKNLQISMQKPLESDKHPMNPLQKGQPVLMESDKGHCLWKDQWKITGNGDLLNVDQQKINIQSSVLKLVVKRMGRNLLAGKSVLNMSLPIEIFGNDSNLQRLAKGYIYAPKFLQKASLSPDPVDKMKYAFCFGLGFSLAYIEMQKPFNPILGQTYQGMIDGCPVFGEQISHHPPISSLFMRGRGYKVFGNFEAKVEMGMNSASGINDGFNNIVFDDGTVIKLNSPPGQISGLIYGDRKLSLIRNSIYIDQQDRLFMDVSWGKNKSAKDEFSQFHDHFSGTLVRIKESAAQKFNLQTDYKKIKKDQIEEEIGVIFGRFTGKVFFNQQLLFDVQVDRPYQMLDYQKCLQSDCRHRIDIKYRKLNDFVRAQQGKEELEQIQRRDRKLRKEHHH